MGKGISTACSGERREIEGLKPVAHRILIAGAGIGGLAAALALARKGCEVTVLEATKEFGDVGAGIQLGPNAMKVLAALGLESQVHAVASFPESIVITDAASGKPISRMLLGNAVRERYGQAYASLHRADLHALLLHAAHEAGVQLHNSQMLQKYEHSAQEIRRLDADFDHKYDAKYDVLIGADGLHSRVREQMLGDGAPRATGHAAFRVLLPADAMPKTLRTPHVRTWWGRDVHVVSYPLRQQSGSGSLWNVVVLAEMPGRMDSGWSLNASHEEVMRLFKRTEPQLQALLDAGSAQANGWKRWNLFDRKPLKAVQMAQGRVALLGDAAHPMLPYLAQGAAMALEDAWVLAQCLSSNADAPQALQNYAQLRAARNARVVQTAQRNGRIFHLRGAMALARNAVLSLKGTQVIGLPWLYGFNPCA
jgi:salicylate hydroxylase